MASISRIIDRLPAFALPFVTRSLRGGRGQRYMAMSLGLALLTAMLCLWIGLGRGDLARQVRVDVGIEMNLGVREHHDFILIRTGRDAPHSMYARQAEWMEARRIEAAQQGLSTVVAAVQRASEVPREHVDLLHDAQALMQSRGLDSTSDSSWFSWTDPSAIHRLQKIVEQRGEPQIVDYTPMVTLDDMLRLLAMVTGGLLILLLTVFAPLLVALQQASERHENTLQPLTGTALGARELCVGLACGPLAIVAIFAAPIAALYLGAALATGELGSLLLLPMLAGTAIGLVFGVQLLAHLSGTKRAPGLIGVALLGLLGMLGMASLGFASVPQPEIVGVSAVLPQTGMFALLGESFGDPWRAASLDHFRPRFHVTFADIVAPALIGMLGAALLGLLALRALARHVEGRSTLLDASEALVGALVCIVMVDVALPALDAGEPFRQAVGLPMLAIPFFLLIMTRVPTGDIPSKFRQIPMTRLLGEYATWVVLHVSIAAVLDGTLAGLHPIAMLGIAWCAAVMVLLAVRLVATPARILGTLWVLVCMGMLPFTYGFATVWAFEPGARLSTLAEVPVLTMPWAALVVLVPLFLVRHLRLHVASIAPKTR